MNIQKIIEDEIRKIVSGNEPSCHDENKGDVRIAILNRGWVAVGNFTRNGDMCKITNGSVIRRWGTSKGLGELAKNGPQDDTTLDSIESIEFHILTTVGIMECNQSKWK